MINNNLYWCESTWEALVNANKENRFPHALLFFGNQGLGKKELAHQLANYLLCSDSRKNQAACGVCKDCVLFLANTHGDFHNILPEKTKGIGIDQVREIKSEASQKPQRNQVKVFLIPDADKMSSAASNALLKVLEEPPGGSVFILTSERKHFLSPTVLSRCQHYGFLPPDSKVATQWLASCGTFLQKDIDGALTWSLGSPLLALNLLENNLVKNYQSYANLLITFFTGEISLFSLSKSWQGQPLVDIVFVAQMTCYYLLKGDWKVNFNKKLAYQWTRKIIDIKKMMATHIALNESLIMDFLFSS